MVPTIRRSALALALTLAGFLFWQAVQATAQPDKEHEMTVADTGEKLRCKILKVTVQENGVKLYDLEVVGTGEQLKAEEVVRPAVPGQERERRMMPLRILQRRRNRDLAGSTQTETAKTPRPADETKSLHNNVIQGDSPASETKKSGLIQRMGGNPAGRTKSDADEAQQRTAPARIEPANYRRPGGTESYSSAHTSRLPKVANRLTQIMPSGRPAESDRTGPYPHSAMPAVTQSTPTMVSESKHVVTSPSRVVVQGHRAPEQRTSTTGLIPKWMGQQTRSPQVVMPTPSTGSSVIAGHRAPSTTPVIAPVPTQNQLDAGKVIAKEVKPAPVTSPSFAIVGEKHEEPRTAPKSASTPARPSTASLAATTKPAMQAPKKEMQSNRLPAGAGSVIAARSGVAPVTFVPVPIVTVPDPLRRPGPPEPMIPDPPQPNVYVNAFSPSQNGRPMQASMPNPAHLNQPPMRPAMPMAQPQVMPMHGMVNTNPVAQPIPVYYRGPLPPNPNIRPQIVPMNHGQPMPMPMPVAPAMSAAPGAEQQLMQILRDSPFPSQREWAARMLTSCEPRLQQQTVPVLMEIAQKDPAASVRASCVACLVQMRVPAGQMNDVLLTLQNDNDPRVRQEVIHALAQCGIPAQVQTDRQMIQPVGVAP